MFRVASFSIDQVLSLVQLGWRTYQEIKAAHVSAAIEIRDASGAVISPEQLDARITAALAKAFGVGDDAVSRIAASVSE
jgi:hypothetical protein